MMARGPAKMMRAGCPSFKDTDIPLGEKRLVDPPLALDVRMPPLHPKRSARLQTLAAGHGSLFAGAPRMRTRSAAVHLTSHDSD
jgi:hypothetical protein